MLPQLAHDVVTTLGFGYFLVASSDNVVTMLYFRHRYYDQKLTFLQRFFSKLAFRPGINVAPTSWFWSRFLDKNLKVLQYHCNFFPKDMQYCIAIPFFDKHIYSLFCIRQCKAFAQLENLQLVAWTEKRNFWSCVVHWSETAPCLLAVNSVGSWFDYFLRTANQNAVVYYLCATIVI